MSDIEQLFNSLDDGTGEGVALHKVLEGDAAAAKNASPALVAKDDSGNLIYLRTNASGELIMAPEGASSANCKGGHFAKTTGSTSRTQVGGDISLVAGKELSQLEWSVNCLRAAVYEIVVVDDPAGTPVETPIVDIMVSEGDNQDSGKQDCLEDIDTTGMTDPVLRIYATNTKVASDFRARATFREAA